MRYPSMARAREFSLLAAQVLPVLGLLALLLPGCVGGGRDVVTTPSAGVRSGSETAAFARVLEEDTVEACERYLRDHPEGAHRHRVLELRAERVFRQLRTAREPDRLVQWLADNPGSVHAEEARALLEELTLERLRSEPTVAACDAYLRAFPEGLHAAELRDLRRDLEWEEVVAARDLETVREWLARHPESLRAEQARALWEELLYEQVLSAGTLETCERYLSEFPDGPRAEQVRARRAALAWESIRAQRDPAALEDWLTTHAGSRFELEARHLLEDLRFEELEGDPAPERCREYLRTYPDGRHADGVRRFLEQGLAWERAAAEDTVEGYRTFAASHRGSVHRGEAQERSSLRFWQRRVAGSPDDDHALVQLSEACLLAASCTLDQIRGYLERAVGLNPDNPRALLGLAKMHYNRSDYGEAEELLRRSVAVEGGIAETHLYLGRLEARRNRCRVAIPHLDRALELTPGDGEALFHRGVCRSRIEGCQAGAGDFRRLIERATDPESKLVLQAERYLTDCDGGLR